MNSFLIALQFLTITPIPYTFIASDKQLGNSCAFYPLIGLLIGCLLIFTAFLTNSFSFQFQATIILIVWVLITGGLHLDGLADCADAWVGGLGNKQRSLEIMKDPAAGPIAVIALVLVLLLKWSMIIVILEQQKLAALVLAPMLGRLAILFLMQFTNYIRTGGLAEKLLANLPETSVKVVSLLTSVIAFYYLGVIPIVLIAITLLIIAYQTKKRLGGVTGDVYGAAVELTEVSVLLGVLL